MAFVAIFSLNNSHLHSSPFFPLSEGDIGGGTGVRLIQTPDEIFKSRGEVYFKFNIPDQSEIKVLTRIISIDDVKGNEVYAYANRNEFNEFLKFHYSFTVLPPPSTLLKESDLNMGNSQKKDPGNINTVWNFYPTYQQYLDFMAGFANAYPSICRLDTIGTSVQGRLLLGVKISDSVAFKRSKPEIFYSSTIHGDEPLGYVLLLHLIDYLLSGYGIDTRITNMINNNQIYINPLANPDGTYHGGNNTVFGATRYNANNADLNRNFPDPQAGLHPDGLAWQPETVAFMKYADSTRFVESLNFHGGSEVFNYPWDTWAKLHPDDDWWQFVAREYADTVHAYGPSGYFTELMNGITNGYAWYQITGGRQDYTTYYKYGREATVEMSYVKTPAASLLLNYWTYQFHSLLNYIDQASFGVNGRVTDSVTGNSVYAKIFAAGHDFDNSWVYSKIPSGWYYRPVDQGSYTLVFSAPNYYSKTIDVSVARWATTHLNVRLIPLNIGIVNETKITTDPFVFPNPSDGIFRIVLPKSSANDYDIQIYNSNGASIIHQQIRVNGELFYPMNLTSLPKGIYFIRLTDGHIICQNKIVLL